MSTSYRIVKNIYTDMYGTKRNEHYHVEKLKSLLGFKYWSEVKHTVGGMSGNYKQTTEFDTYDEAMDFIHKVLCKGIKTTDWNSEVVSYTDC